MENEFPGEALKAVFPLMDGKDLVFCMLVCRQWREIAKDDYFWKCICTRKWPSICKHPPPDTNYKNLYLTFSKPQKMQDLPVPRLTFDDLVFYIDMWLEESLIFSRAVSGSIFQAGLQSTPPGIPDVLVTHLNSLDCILVMEVEPKLRIPMGHTITVSVLHTARIPIRWLASLTSRCLITSTVMRRVHWHMSISDFHPDTHS